MFFQNQVLKACKCCATILHVFHRSFAKAVCKYFEIQKRRRKICIKQETKEEQNSEYDDGQKEDDGNKKINVDREQSEMEDGDRESSNTSQTFSLRLLLTWISQNIEYVAMICLMWKGAGISPLEVGTHKQTKTRTYWQRCVLDGNKQK